MIKSKIIHIFLLTICFPFISFANYGFFADCPAFFTVGGVNYEVGACSSTGDPQFDGTTLTNISSFNITYAEMQTFENGGDDVFNGMVWYRVYTGAPSGAFTQLTLSTVELLGGGDERRKTSTSIDLLAGKSASTTYVLEIYYQGEVDWNGTGPGKDDDIYHSNGGSNFKLTFTTAASLPIDMKFFEVEKNGNSVSVLKWQTASETQNSHFIIQRSADSKNWQPLGRVEGHGTIFDAQEYTFTDRQPFNGKNYYRLEQFDFNGKTEYSKVTSIDMQKNDHASISPNPVKEELFVHLPAANEGSFTAEVFNIQGQMVASQNVQLGEAIHVSALVPGIYLLRMENEMRQVLLTERFVKK